MFSPKYHENRHISTSFLCSVVDENEEISNDDDFDNHDFIEDFICSSEVPNQSSRLN